MSVNILVIGINSYICRQLIEGHIEADYCSHSDILDIDFEKYRLVFVLSFSRSSLEENLKLLETIPPSKLLYASTIAVQSFAVRPQWARYPSFKSILEKKVIASGGRVVRIGILTQNEGGDMFGVIPVTSREDIITVLDKCEAFEEQIMEAYTLKTVPCTTFPQKVARLAYTISRLMPAWRGIQVPIAIIMRLSRFTYYGYTADALQCFSEQIQVGFGVLGANRYRLCPSKPEMVIASPRETVSLNTYGFKGTRIGYGPKGLAKYWHGVSLAGPDNQTGPISKQVPIWIRRFTPPRHKLCAEHITSVQQSASEDLYLNTDDHQRVFCTKKLVLSAGPLENARILRSLTPLACSFSDHEIGKIGEVEGAELISKGIIKKLGPFAIRTSVLQIADEPLGFVLDFRPLNMQKHLVDPNLYDDTTSGILKKLIVRGSIKSVNEAVFNKFGISIYTKKFAVYSQILARKCITLTDEGLKRTRLDLDQISEVVSRTELELGTFLKEKHPALIDAQHIVGGSELLDDPEVRKLLEEGTLEIIGSPTSKPLGPGHHTRGFLVDISVKKFN